MTDDAGAAVRKTVIVTSPNGDELEYAAGEFLSMPDGLLIIGPEDNPAAVIAPGQWSSVRKQDAVQGNGSGTFDRCPTCAAGKSPAALRWTATG
jgi:hypothetical protein